MSQSQKSPSRAPKKPSRPPSSPEPASSQAGPSPVQEVQIPVTALLQSAGMASVTSYEGPIPPAAEAERYEALCPGAFERMLASHERHVAMEEKQQDYLHVQEPKWREMSHKAHLRGQLGGIAALVLAFLCAFYLGLQADSTGDYILAGLFMSAPVMTAIIALFRRK